MPAAPPNIEQVRRAASASRKSAASLSFSLQGVDTIDPNEADLKILEDESRLEIPPGVDTPWTWWGFMRYFGPGWLVCIAYVDPGNYQADIQSGATTGYTQNWVFLWTELLSWYVQYMCVKLQHYSNKNLAQAMAMQYPKYVRWMFWVIAEVSIVLTDLPEVIGFAIAINLFNKSVPLYAGVLLSFLTTMLFLATLHKGSYFIELTACTLVVIMSIVLFVEWEMSPTNATKFLAGAFVPALKMDPSAVQSIISIIGAVVMPHNLYLHSGALESRRCPSVIKYKKRAVWLGLWDPFFPILSTTVVNMCIATLAAIYVFEKNVPEADSLGIASFPQYLNIKGGTTMWGIALIAAAQSSCITTTYSGQFVMDGFLKINLPMWSRALFTRCVAVVPCVLVAAFTNSRTMEQMIDAVNSSLAFLLPFALIPLVRLTTSRQFMGQFVAGWIESVIIWAATLLCFGINFYTLVAPNGTYFGQYTGTMNTLGVQMNIVQDLLCVFYTGCCVYMAFAPVKGTPLPMREEMDQKDYGDYGHDDDDGAMLTPPPDQEEATAAAEGLEMAAR